MNEAETNGMPSSRLVDRAMGAMTAILREAHQFDQCDRSCKCGWRPDGDDGGEYLRHVAEAILAVTDEVRGRLCDEEGEERPESIARALTPDERAIFGQGWDAPLLADQTEKE